MPVHDLAAPPSSGHPLEVAAHAVNAILASAEAFDFEVEGTKVRVDVTGAKAALGWVHGAGDRPGSVIPVLAAERRLQCHWPGGGIQLELASLSASAADGQQRIGLVLRTVSPQRTVLGIGISNLLRPVEEGRVPIRAWFNPTLREGEERNAVFAAFGLPVRVAVQRSGLTLASPNLAIPFEVDVQSGAVHPSPFEAFRNVVRLGLLKLPLSLRGEEAKAVGKPLYDLAAMIAVADPEARAEAARPELKKGLGTLPGGVREQKKTLDALLGEIAARAMTEDDFREHLRIRYGVTGEAAWHSYGTVMELLGFIDWEGTQIVLAPEGRAYLQDPSPVALFRRLDETFMGFLEALVVVEQGGATSAEMTAQLNHLIGTAWETSMQAGRRRDWLLSLGATERSKGRDVLTALGRSLLADRAEDVERIRGELEVLALEGPRDEGGPKATQVKHAAPAAEVEAEARDVPSSWDRDRVDLVAARAAEHLEGLQLPQLLLEQACAALSAGKHLLLVGPPGTGKTELAHVLSEAAKAEGYCAGAFVTTASADWTTFETIGGYALQPDRSLALRPGAFLQALERRQWLVIDELNRADVDRAFGELMTVLAGRSTQTTLVGKDGRLVSIGAEPDCTHQVFGSFRVIATMNTWDKTSLFRLSHAVQRRFAVLHVGIPEDDVYRELLATRATQDGLDPRLPARDVTQLQRLFSSQGLLVHRQVGPAVALDMVKYLRRRQAGGDGLAEAIELFLLPQLEGLEQEAALRVLSVFGTELGGFASDEALTRLTTRYAELFPHLSFPKA